MQQLALSFNSTDMHIRRSSRARRLRVSVSPVGRIEVVVPNRVNTNVVEQFIQQQQPWIDSMRQKIAGMRSSELDQQLPNQILLPSINENWKVKYYQSKYNSQRNKQNVTNHDSLHLHYQSEDEVEALLKKWLHKKAISSLLPWLQQISEETGLRYSAASVRGQKTRWGSCSTNGNISLNRCMLFLKPTQVRYLLVHELCHTREMNHSVRFWQLVKRFVPDYIAQDDIVNKAYYQLPRWAY